MIKLILKGFIIGIGKIIPGVSGAVIAISMGVYEKALNSIGSFFKKPVENFKYLFPLAIGAFLSIATCSNVILYLITNYYLPIMLLFIGLIFGSVPSLVKKITTFKARYIIYFLLSFSLVFIISFMGNMNIFNSPSNIFIKMFLYFIIGMIDAITMIIPGISGTAVMMLIGCYNMMLELLSNMTNLINFIPFVLGIIIVIILLSKFISYLFNKKTESMYVCILGFVISSVVILLNNIFKTEYELSELIIAIILFIIGVFISIKFEEK